MAKRRPAQIKQDTPALVKVRLWHARGFSLIVPDLIVVEDREPHVWFQPAMVTPPFLYKHDSSIECTLYVDLHCRHSSNDKYSTVQLRFSAADKHVFSSDGSEWYRCRVTLKRGEPPHPAGNCRWVGSRLMLKLFHHTTPVARDCIVESKTLRLSSWNLQGTKRVDNVAFHYLTQLQALSSDDDLARVGMSPNGHISLRTDYDEVLSLKVYRSSTRDRSARLVNWVDAAHLQPKHMYCHTPANAPVYYEICQPFIHRIGGAPGSSLGFESDTVLSTESDVRGLEYMILGDATRVSGIQAPYDEEETNYIMKLQRVESSTNILEYWFEQGNSELFSQISVWFQSFQGNQ